MMKLYLCTDCKRLVLASRRASVRCPKCEKENLPLTRLSFLEYTEMSEEKRREYAELWSEKMQSGRKGGRE